jgi:uncharacterized membrane protein YeaQ/YmgE (transglycosylase-associated protein family)
MGYLSWIAVGAIVGLCAYLLTGTRHSLPILLVLGMIGGLIGGLIAAVLGLGVPERADLNSAFAASLGAIALLFLSTFRKDTRKLFHR